MPTRRWVLPDLTAFLAATPGCLRQINQIGTGDEDEKEDLPPGISVVRYEELSHRDQQFVDATMGRGGHTVKYLNRSGKRVYIEYNRSTSEYVVFDDPLVLESIDNALQDVYDNDDVYLAKGGRYYEATGGAHFDDADYRYNLTVVQADECDHPTHLDELSGFDAELAGVLLNRGDAVVGSEKFDPIAQADVYFDGAELFEFEDQFGDPNGACLEAEGQTVRVERTGSELADVANWELREADIDQE